MRTLTLIKRIGIERNVSSMLHRHQTLTSKGLPFQFPNDDRDFILSFSATLGRHHSIGFDRDRIQSLSSTIDVSGNTSPAKLARFVVSPEVYIRAKTSTPNSTRGEMVAVSADGADILGFTDMLRAGESLLAKRPVASLLDKLPVPASTQGYHALPFSSNGPSWPLLQ